MPAATEYEVKAAYLYNFSKFVQWPVTRRRSAGTFDVCILGADPFGAAIDRVATGAVVGVRVVRVRRLTTLDEAASCHILFVSQSGERPTPEVLAALGRSDVLTVSDMPQFLNDGGIIQFVLQGSRVRFEVNLPRAQAAGLTLSSELLRVATVVRRDEVR
jgi:hypothetical protein